MKNTQAYARQVKGKGAEHELGSPHLHAAAGLIEALAEAEPPEALDATNQQTKNQTKQLTKPLYL